MAESQYRLIVRQGPIAGQIFELNKPEITIGRDISNDFVINDAEVSRKHARISLEGERYRIEDLNSTNGTYIDGQRLIGPHLLAVGEIIMFGDNVGVVFEGEPSGPDITVPSTLDLGQTPVSAIPTPAESYVRPAVYPPPEFEKAIPPPEESLEQVSEEEQAAETGKKPFNSWLLAGCGCLLVLVVLVIALLVFIDQPWKVGGGLYCNQPFVYIFRSLGFCP